MFLVQNLEICSSKICGTYFGQYFIFLQTKSDSLTRKRVSLASRLEKSSTKISARAAIKDEFGDRNTERNDLSETQLVFNHIGIIIRPGAAHRPISRSEAFTSAVVYVGSREGVLEI